MSVSSPTYLLIPGGLVAPYWIQSDPLCELINQSPLGQLIERWKVKSIEHKQSESEIVPTHLPHESWLAKLHDFAHPSDFAAAMSWNDDAPNEKMQKQASETGGWWRVDPVSCRLATDHVTLANGQLDDITAEESAALIEALQPALSEYSIELIATHPRRWYLRWADLPANGVPIGSAPCLLPSSPWAAQGRSIDAYLPKNVVPSSNAKTNYARNWRRLVTEAEMAWFDHPVNKVREQNGQLPVNSLWLIGACHLQFEKNPDLSTVSLWTKPLPECLSDQPYEWAQAMSQCPTSWITKLNEQINAGGPVSIMLSNENQLRELQLSKHTPIRRLVRKLSQQIGSFSNEATNSLKLSDFCAQTT